MKSIVLERDNLFEALRTAGPAVDPKGKTSTSGRIRLQNKDGHLEILASGGDMKFMASLPHEGEGKLDLHLPHRSLVRLVQAAGKSVILEEEDSELLLRSGNRTLRLLGEDGEIYPDTPHVGDAKKFCVLSGEEFSTALQQTARAASTDPSRPALASLLLEPREKDFALLATDSYRLVLFPLKAKNRGKNLPRRLLALKATVALQTDINRHKPETVELHYWEEEGGGMSVSYDNKVWTFSLLQGDFPDVKKIIPLGGEVLGLNSRELSGALKAVEAIQGGFRPPRAQSSVGALHLKLGKQVSLMLDAPGVGKMEEVLSKATWSGKEMTVGIHPLFLADMLRVFDEKRIFGRVLSPEEPVVFESEDGRTYLTMPVRLPDLETKK